MIYLGCDCHTTRSTVHLPSLLSGRGPDLPLIDDNLPAIGRKDIFKLCLRLCFVQGSVASVCDAFLVFIQSKKKEQIAVLVYFKESRLGCKFAPDIVRRGVLACDDSDSRFQRKNFVLK